MKTAAAATSASRERGAADRQVAEERQQAGRRLKELAAHLGVHRGFSDVIASLEAGHGGALGGVTQPDCRSSRLQSAGLTLAEIWLDSGQNAI